MAANNGWKDIAELIGIAAIVASLIALVIELRQTQAALSASTYQERAFDAIAESVTVADSDHVVHVLAATDGGSDFDAVARLNEVDRLRLVNILRARMVDWDNEHYQYQQGFLDEDFFRETTVPAVRMWAPRWRNIGLTEARKGFRDFVDRVLADAPAEED